MISCCCFVAGQRLRSWRAEQLAWAAALRAADAALRDGMRAVSNAHIYIWHMPPGCALEFILWNNVSTRRF